MQKPTRFGFCGLVGCVCSFCLSTVTGLPQDAKPADANSAPSQESLASTNGPSLQQLMEQNLAMLKALGQFREDREASLNQYTETIASQLNLLRDALILQRGQELRAAQASNRFILTVAASVAGVAVIIMLISALLPVWALKRFADKRAVAQLGTLFPPSQSKVGSGADLALLDILGETPVLSPLGGAVEKLEHRLLALEKRASQSQADAREEGTGSRGQKEEGGKSPTPGVKTIPAPGKPETSSGKSRQAAHVAITLGAGEAIGFLPRDAGPTRFRSLRAFLGKCKRVFRRAPS